MVKFLVSLYGVTVLALVWGAVSIWRLRCEGFGCMGVGVAWFAWVIAYVFVLGVGLLTRHKAASVAGLAPTARVTWWLQLAVGALAAIVWFVKRMN